MNPEHGLTSREGQNRQNRPNRPNRQTKGRPRETRKRSAEERAKRAATRTAGSASSDRGRESGAAWSGVQTKGNARDNQSEPFRGTGAGKGRAGEGASDRGRERGYGKRAERTQIKAFRSVAERGLPGTSDERTLETELTSGGGQSQSRQNMSDRTRTVPESARRCEGAGEAGCVNENERSTSYGEGGHQPAKTERKARGRSERRRAGQDRGVLGRNKRDWRHTVVAGRRDPERGSTERGREGTTGDERREVARERADEQRRTEPEEAEHERQGTDSTWESAGLPRLGKPHGAMRCGAAEHETRVKRSTSYGEGEHG